MAYQSIQKMLQTSLIATDLRVSIRERLKELGLEMATADYLAQADRLPSLHLCRQRPDKQYPIRYSWSLLLSINPQQYSGKQNFSLTDCAVAIKSDLDIIRLNRSSMDPSLQTLQHLEIKTDDLGYLYLELSRPGIELWIEQCQHLPLTSLLIPIESSDQKIRNVLEASRPLADQISSIKRLRLSPIFFLQYNHAYCYRYITQPEELRSLGTSQSVQTPEFDRMIWYLIALQDTLTEPDGCLQQKLRLGSELCAALQEWEKSATLRQISHPVACYYALRWTLNELLQGHLGYIAPAML